MSKRADAYEIRLNRHKKYLDNNIGTLKATRFMQEMNTICKDSRRHDFKRDKISNSIDSKHYQPCEKTVAERLAGEKLERRRLLQSLLHKAFMK